MYAICLQTKAYVEFLVGRDGGFDLLAASVIKRSQALLGTQNSALIWVLPYLTAEFREYEEDYLRYYDEVEVCERSAMGYPKAAFWMRNRAMVDRSDLVLCYLERMEGGAYKAVKYAGEQGRPIIYL